MASSLTRGPLPAKVYWRRRMVLIGGALALVLGLGRLLGGGSDGSSDDPGVAEQVAAAPTSTAPSRTPAVTRKPRPTKSSSPTPTPTPTLAVPDGPCDDADVSVTPSVVDAIAGRDVVVLLELRTIIDEACTWRVSPSHLTVSITSGADDIWSSQQCPASVPVEDVTVRQDVTTTVSLVWNAKRSDEDCSRLTAWAMPGYYHVAAAALGGEPLDVQFRLTKPVPEVVVETTPPEPKGGKGAKGAGGGKPNQPDDDAAPSGAVEPNG